MTEHRNVQITTLSVGLFGTNCYIFRAGSGEVAVVDPGEDAERICRAVAQHTGQVRYLLLTHGHLDHIMAVGSLREKFNAQAVLHRDDLPLWEQIGTQAALFGLPPPEQPDPPDVLLEGGESFSLGALSIEVLHTPGHSPGSVCFFLRRQGLLFNGDTVFSMGVGRTDLWGGDSARLLHSIQNGIFALPGEVTLLPGHGPPVTVDEARRTCPLGLLR